MRVKGDPIIFVSLLAAVASLYILIIDGEYAYDFSSARRSETRKTKKNCFPSNGKSCFLPTTY